MARVFGVMAAATRGGIHAVADRLDVDEDRRGAALEDDVGGRQ